jgi:hypothetical protein
MKLAKIFLDDWKGREFRPYANDQVIYDIAVFIDLKIPKAYQKYRISKDFLPTFFFETNKIRDKISKLEWDYRLTKIGIKSEGKVALEARLNEGGLTLKVKFENLSENEIDMILRFLIFDETKAGFTFDKYLTYQ